MITLLRRIRQQLLAQNRFSKYLIYAIGEIILVVIGILIALQINNWNENRKLKENETIILKDLIEDLNSDYVSFQEGKKDLETQLQLVDELITDPHNSSLANTHLNFIRYIVDSYPITFENNIPEGIYNKALLENLKAYYRKQQVLFTDNETYRNVVTDLVRPFLRKHGIHNPSVVIVSVDEFINTGAIANFGEELLNKDKLSLLYDSDEFRQILFELRIKTAEYINDINTLCKANKELMPVIKDYIK